MIYLHIGYPKTGSTSIQNAANINRQILMDANLLYPNSCVVTDGHHNIFYELCKDDFKGTSFSYQFKPDKGTISDLITEVKLWKQSNPSGDTLISSEGLFSLKQKPFSSLLSILSAVDTVKVVIVLRRQDFWLRSFWSMEVTRLKTSHSPDHWYANDKTFRRLNYNRRIREVLSYQQGMDLQVIGFNEFDKRKILESFIDLVVPSIKLKSKVVYPNNLNSSPSDKGLAYLLNIADDYRDKLSQKDKIDLVGKLHNKSVKYDWYEKREKSYYRFSKDTLQLISEKYSPSNKLLTKKYPNLIDSLDFDDSDSSSLHVPMTKPPSFFKMLDINRWLKRQAKKN